MEKTWFDLTTLCRDAVIAGLQANDLEPNRELALSVAAALIGVAVQFSENHSGDRALLRGILDAALSRDGARSEALIREFTGVPQAVCVLPDSSPKAKN